MTLIEWGSRVLFAALMAIILVALPFLACLSWMIDPEAETYALELQDFWEAWRGTWEAMK